MSNVSITDTTYNITVEESDTSVTVTSGDAITVLVDTFTISTQVNNTGTGAEIGKDILGDTLFLRSIVAGSGITITENTNDITIGYTNTAGYISDYTVTQADVTGHQAALSITESQISDLQSYITGYTVTEADVTGHQAALTITESQISDLDHYTNTDWDTQLATKTTSNLTEGTNLYYTQTRANDSILNYTGNINNMGDITGDDAIFDNVRSVIETDNINAIGSNITMDLSGYLHVDTDEVYVGSFTQAVKITDTGITNLGSTALTFTGNLTGDVTGTVSDVSNHDTGDIAEGSNLYYTDARVQTKLGSVSGHILPDNTVGTRDLGSATNNWGRIYGDQVYADQFYTLTGNTFLMQGHIVPTGNKLWDLGSPSNQFRSAYIGPGSLYIDGQKVIGSDATGDIDITTDSGQNLNISSGADIKFIPQVGETDQGFVVELDRVELGVDADSTITLNGTSEIADLHIGDLEIDPTLINNTGTNQNLEIRTNGTGYLHANTSNLYVGPISGATKITANSVSATSGTLTVTGNLTGDVTGTVSDISNHTTSALTEGTNLYHTDARVQSVINTNSAGFITTYDPTQADITQHQAALSITESQISDLTHYTNAQAITAVQGEATLDLTGDVTIAQDLDVTGLVKVNDGFTIGSFDPYSPAGLPSTSMDLTIMGIGEEEGWAALGVRSRGEHAWGLTGFGIPNEPPRSIFALQAGRLDGSSDDYLNNNDPFAQMMFNPYTGYKTGLEWLTPSAEIRAIATEDHSTSGFGTKLSISTTENGNSAGATDAQHTHKTITIQGTTISTSDTLKLDDAVEITGTLNVKDVLTIEGSASTKSTIIGDYTSAGYDFHGMKLDGGDTAWAGIVFKEFDGANKPIANFTNPGFQTEVFGGTPASPAPLGTGKRLLAINGSAGYDNTTTAPPISNVRMIGVTTETQSTTARGAKWEIYSTPNGGTSPQNTLEVVNGDTIVINADGDGKISSGGILTLDDAVIVEETLQVKGNTDLDGTLNVDGDAVLMENVTLGNDNTSDIVVMNARVDINGVCGFINVDTATANYYAGLEAGGFITLNPGSMVYVTDGNGGSSSPCMAFYDGTNWKKMHSPADNISAS